MPLSVRNPRVLSLAKDLAAARHTTMTNAIMTALENELIRERLSRPLSERLANIARDLRDEAGPDGRSMTKAEIDAMWHD